MDRNKNLQIVAERTQPWDIVVIGGGATGAGCALDAASRGLSVLLLEQHDFGKGTSSRSTKLIHGGVRYLRQGNISLVREALRERSILLKNAPHVVHKQSFVIPCYSYWQKAFYGLGMKIYDLLASRHNIGASHIISREETLRHLPSLKQQNLRGGVLYYDGQFDDTRLLIDILRTANMRGAVVLNYARVISLTKDAEGKICGLGFEDGETGQKFSVYANCVINATGAFCDPVRRMSDASAESIVTFAQGIHLVFDRKFLPSDAALMIPKTSDGRVLFCIPWHDHLLVGTTDTAVNKAEIEPGALESEIDFIIETAGVYLASKPTRSDILSVFAGIRPLIKSTSNTKTSSISRGHDLFVDASGLITITGGKWTTYRRMAEDAVDRAVEVSGLELRRSITDDLPIAGDDADATDDGEQLHPDLPYTREDIVKAIREEMARTVEDVLARRTRALFLNARAAIEISPQVAGIMAEELGRDQNWIDNEIATFKNLASSYSRPSRNS
ncbi:MAG: glycerol-3-phosphate dehydrogenase/oxidase [Acidobacteria bacterium]|nr:glycerol-3-phosphate dehydrogenase/oxidase [Acidobacteriota bacterium]